MDSIITKSKTLVRLIEQQQFDLSTEKRMQSQLSEVLLLNHYEFEREKILSDKDIPDFLVEKEIIIECKLRGARSPRKMDVYKQLCRYAEHETVKALILASNLSMGIPPEINGKPVFAASCSKGWL
jgi:hypothetical protein